jgi:dipeptide/tripeptide permease
MNTKTLIWIGMSIGSFLGGLIPTLWGDDVFSMSSVIFTAIGGFTGIWLAYKVTN